MFGPLVQTPDGWSCHNIDARPLFIGWIIELENNAAMLMVDGRHSVGVVVGK